MKKLFLSLVVAVLCSAAFSADILPPKWDANAQDKVLIQSYIDWCKANNVKDLSYLGFMSKVLLACADFNSETKYDLLKAAVKSSLPANAPESAYYNAMYSTLKNIKRFETPANVQAYVAELQKTKKCFWAKANVFKLNHMTPAQRIWAFETGIELTKKVSIALFNLDKFIGVANDYNANEVLVAAKSLKRKIYSRITDESWKPVLVKLELLIQSLQ